MPVTFPPLPVHFRFELASPAKNTSEKLREFYRGKWDLGSLDRTFGEIMTKEEAGREVNCYGFILGLNKYQKGQTLPSNPDKELAAHGFEFAGFYSGSDVDAPGGGDENAWKNADIVMYYQKDSAETPMHFAQRRPDGLWESKMNYDTGVFTHALTDYHGGKYGMRFYTRKDQ